MPSVLHLSAMAKAAEKGLCATDQTQEAATSSTVYITNTGKKYHRAGCIHLRKSRIPISLNDAKARGYTACSRRKPG